MVYMAQCPSGCASATTSELSWVLIRYLLICVILLICPMQFKIDQAGLINGTLTTGVWGMGELVANNNSWTSTIPASLTPGEYFIRHEVSLLL